MRIIIDQDLEFDLGLFDETVDADLLKSSTVFYTLTDTSINIHAQKIDLLEPDMEDVLTLLDWLSDKQINLVRYSHGRYSLELK